MRLTPYFRSWCKHTLPLVYDDSLSYYELLCKLVGYINDCIQGIQASEEAYNELLEAYGNLEDYVNHYFDTSDFQSMVDKKLDEMAKDGTLTELFNKLVDDITSKVDTVDSKVTGVDNKVDALETKVNNYITTNDEAVSYNKERICYHYIRTWSSEVSGNSVTFRDYRNTRFPVETEIDRGDKAGTLADPYDSVEYVIRRYVDAGFSDARMIINTGGYYYLRGNLMSNMSLHIVSEAPEPVYLVFELGDIHFNTYGCHIHLQGNANAPLVFAYQDRLQGDYSKTNHDYIYFEGGTIYWRYVEFNTGVKFFGIDGHADLCTFKTLTIGEGSNIYSTGCTYGGSELGGDSQTHIVSVETNGQLTTDVSGSKNTSFIPGGSKSRTLSVSNGGVIIRDTPTVSATTIANAGLVSAYSTVLASDNSIANLATVGSGNNIYSSCIRGGN